MTVEKLWKHLCNDHWYLLEMKFQNVEFVDSETSDCFIDAWDTEGNEYTFYKQDLPSYIKKYERSEYSDSELVDIILHQLVDQVTIKTLDEQDPDVVERIKKDILSTDEA